MNTRDEIREYFERCAGVWGHWQTRNGFYHGKLHSLVRGMVSPGARVLEIGCGNGDLLAALRPRRGVGLNFAPAFTELARRRHPHLEFHTVEVDQVKWVDDFAADYVVLNNMLDYVYDIWDLFESLRAVMHAHSLLVMTTNNPLWAPVLSFASRIGQRIPDSPRNFITNRDIVSVLRLQGVDVVEEGLTLPVPKHVPALGAALNTVVPEIPVVRYVSSVQYIAARPRLPRPLLSCSVVIPCHNEEDNIADAIRRVPTMGAWTEIVVVDDGSVDGTRARVREVMRTDERVRLVAFDKNRGKAKAVEAGFTAARGDVLMILDADMAVAPEELPKFFRPLQEGRADFVNGTRLVYPMQGRAMKFANYLGNKAFCFLASWVLRQRVSDTLCGTKAFFRADFARMPLAGRERWGDFNLLFGAARLRLRILEVPVHYQERRAGTSKMRVMRDGWLFLRACGLGWMLLRRPDARPLRAEREPVTGWHEVEPDAGAAPRTGM